MSDVQPWTAAGASRQATDLEKEKKLELLLLLRNDLEKVRTLTELVKKREREKLRRSQTVKAIIEQLIFPRSAIFRAATRSIIQLDTRGLFTNAVDKTEVPDYYEIITKPMYWTRILEKIDENTYIYPGEWAEDINLVLDNVLKYNKPEDKHGKAAIKLRSQIEPVLQAMEDAFSAAEEEGQGVPQAGGLRALHREILKKVADEETIRGLRKIWYPKPAVAQAAATQRGPSLPAAQAGTSAAAPSTAVTATTTTPTVPPTDAGITALSSIIQRIADPSSSALPAGAGHGPSSTTATKDRASTTASNKSKKRKRAIAQDGEGIDVGPGFRAAKKGKQNAGGTGTAANQERHESSTAPRNERMQEIETAAIPAPATSGAKERDIPAPTIEALAETIASLQQPSLEEAAATGNDITPAAAAAAAAGTAVDGPPTFAIDQSINEWGMEVDREQVSHHDSFLLFNSGWVLPEGSTRRRAKSAFADPAPRYSKPSKQFLRDQDVSV